MKDWAEFEPRLVKTRIDAGQVYYPAAYSHIVEQHWDYLHTPRVEDAIPDYVPMEKYASAAARLRFSLNMLVDADAPEKSQEIAYAGAMSRRCPVQDAQDYWKSATQSYTVSRPGQAFTMLILAREIPFRSSLDILAGTTLSGEILQGSKRLKGHAGLR
jgi:hypothetical protein